MSINVFKNHTEEIGGEKELMVGRDVKLNDNKDLSTMVNDSTGINSCKDIQLVAGKVSIMLRNEWGYSA